MFSTVFCEDCVVSALKKVILFGGSFDPVHSGHVQVARSSLQLLDADRLIFIPARRSPHKSDLPASGHHRLEMVQRAIVGIDSFSVSDCELMRPAPSYTLETIHFFRKQFGDDVVLHWLVGADQLSDFDRWYRVHELLDICHVSVMVRAGYPSPDFARFKDIFSDSIIRQLKDDVVKTPMIDLNSTAIRCQLAAGTVPPEALPPGVFEYIQHNHLYGFSKSSP